MYIKSKLVDTIHKDDLAETLAYPDAMLSSNFVAEDEFGIFKIYSIKMSRRVWKERLKKHRGGGVIPRSVA